MFYSTIVVCTYIPLEFDDWCNVAYVCTPTVISQKYGFGHAYVVMYAHFSPKSF